MSINLTTNFRQEVAKDKENLRNVRAELQSCKTETLVRLQEKQTVPFAVALLNVTGDLNVGVIIRSACIFGAKEVLIFGRNFYDKRSTVGAENYIRVTNFGGLNSDLTISPELVFNALEQRGYTPVIVEQHENAWSMANSSNLFRVLHDKKPCLIFGNEGRGIPDAFLNNLHIKMYIPQRGVLRSLNVSAAASISMWEMVRLYG